MAGGRGRSSYWIGAFSSERVSPVRVSLSFATAAMAPGPTNAVGVWVLPMRSRICPTRSLLPLVLFKRTVSEESVPETTLNMLSFPAYGSLNVLKTKAEKGASGEGLREALSSVLGSLPSRAGRPSGEGRRVVTASTRCRTPTLRVADPQRTGTNFPVATPWLSPCLISSSVRLPPSRYLSMRESSVSAMSSTSFSRNSAT